MNSRPFHLHVEKALSKCGSQASLKQAQADHFTTYLTGRILHTSMPSRFVGYEALLSGQERLSGLVSHKKPSFCLAMPCQHGHFTLVQTQKYLTLRYFPAKFAPSDFFATASYSQKVVPTPVRSCCCNTCSLLDVHIKYSRRPDFQFTTTMISTVKLQTLHAALVLVTSFVSAQTPWYPDFQENGRGFLTAGCTNWYAPLESMVLTATW